MEISKPKGSVMKRKWFWICLSQILMGTIVLCLEQQNMSASMRQVKGGCGSGPCWDLSTGNCGFWYNNTCVIAETGCVGSCGTRCLGTEKHEYCAGVIFRCIDAFVVCANREKPECVPYWIGPPRCACTGGVVIGTCTRSDC